jgi:hypothetical protein
MLLFFSPQALSPVLRPRRVYVDARHSAADEDSYDLRGIVCYYGSHYACFVRTDEAGPFGGGGPEWCAVRARVLCVLCANACLQRLSERCAPVPVVPRCFRSAIWTRIDDASVTVVGSWEALCVACARGHLQPTVLFYERAAAPSGWQ